MENSFYALQLLFACCYLHDTYFQVIHKTVVVEAVFVFFFFMLDIYGHPVELVRRWQIQKQVGLKQENINAVDVCN